MKILSTVALVVLGVGYVAAQDLFVRLPADASARNPLEGNADAITAGMGAFRQRCADCHGVDARHPLARHHPGMGERPD